MIDDRQTDAETVYLSLGSNLGDKRENLDEAIRLIDARVGHVIRISSYIETAPWGFESANRFLNACVAVSTKLSPRDLLRETQNIEKAMGRTQKSDGTGYHDRIIDIDILIYADMTIDDADLRIPHPLMCERDFVMIPLSEILE